MFSLLISVILARLDLAKVFRRRLEEVIKTLDQACASFSSILVTFSDSKKLFILHITNSFIIDLDFDEEDCDNIKRVCDNINKSRNRIIQRKL